MSSQTYDHVRRRLIVCCDGTWQSSVSGERNIPSNVTRMCRHLARSEVRKENDGLTLWNQMVFYDPGIGTGDLSEIDTLRQGGTGAGLAVNVIEAYNWLVLNYQSGDKIYCFGFSRGAYTARSLAGFVAELGICSPLDMQVFPYIYDLYEGALYPEVPGESKRITEDRAKYEEAKKHWENGDEIIIPLGDNSLGGTIDFGDNTRNPIDPESKNIEVVGVWDTVGSLGIPKIGGWLRLPTLDLFKLNKPGRQFHDVRISDNVHHAYHALALDERRRPFTPTLWYVPIGQRRPQGTSFKQVWFPGVHINVGGGSDDVLEEKKSDFEQIANITFAWMVEQVRPHLAFDEASFLTAIRDQRNLISSLKRDPQPFPKSWLKRPFYLLWWLVLKVAGRPWPRVFAHHAWAQGNVVDSFSSAGLAIKLGGSLWRTPGETVVPEDPVNRRPVPTASLGSTDEEVHPCVFWRMQRLGRRSPALRHWVRRPADNPRHGWVWAKPGVDVTLREYRIAGHPDGDGPRNLERLIAETSGAAEYLQHLDEMYASGKDLTAPDTFHTVGV